MASIEEEKSFRFILFCCLLALLGLFFFLFKVEACKSGPESCKDQFFEFNSNSSSHSCSQGATAEVVASPPAPKAGVICHCPRTNAEVK